MNALNRPSAARSARPARRVPHRVPHWEVVAGVVALALPFEAVAVFGVAGLIAGGPCEDGQVLAAHVDERGFVVAPPAEMADDQTFCRDADFDEGYQPEEKIWINPQGNVALKCHPDFGLRQVKMIHAESEAAGYGKFEKPSETPEACQVAAYEVPRHWVDRS